MAWDEQVQQIVVTWASAAGSAAAFEPGRLVLPLLGVGAAYALRNQRPLVVKVLATLGALGVVGLALERALAQAWLADDAFISFRYARHLAEGKGLVWNVGERVEGFTNLLWTLTLALGEWAGVPAPWLATALSLGALAVLGVVLTWKLSRPGWLALSPPVLLLSPAFVEFGTSGLEQGSAAVCIGLATVWLADASSRRFAPWFVALAAALRPDHALFFLPLVLVSFGDLRMRRAFLTAGGAFGLLWLARAAYFHDLVPNTFHTKSGAAPYWTQGTVYWLEFALATGLGLSLLGALVVGAVWSRSRRVDEAPRPRGALFFGVIGTALLTLYVARVGGDFMEFRFGLTTLLVSAVTLELWLGRLAAGRPKRLLVAALVFVPLAFTPRLINDGEKKWHLARESSFYRVDSWRPVKIRSGNFELAQALASLPDKGATAPPLGAGCIGMLGYFSEVPIIDRYGLTDAVIGRKPITERGRPGHEKPATMTELAARGAQWSVDPGWPEPLASRTELRVGSARFWVLQDTLELRRVLRAPPPEAFTSGVTSFEDALDVYDAVTRLFAHRPEHLAAFERRWQLFDAHAFSVEGQGASVEAGRISARSSLHLAGGGACAAEERLSWSVVRGSCDATELRCTGGRWAADVRCSGDELVLEGFSRVSHDVARAKALGSVQLARALRGAPLPEGSFRLGFDDPRELGLAGVEVPASTWAITRGAVSGQGTVRGVRGAGFLNGFAHGDAPKGGARITVPVRAGERYLVAMSLAGGAACDQVKAVVRDGERLLGTVCGRNDERLRTWALTTTTSSERLSVELVDDTSEPWGHVLVDELLVVPLD
ncbi:MAG: hypothetical protein ACOZQL_40920 [Myxococcota bacterium]